MQSEELEHSKGISDHSKTKAQQNTKSVAHMEHLEFTMEALHSNVLRQPCPCSSAPKAHGAIHPTFSSYLMVLASLIS